MKKKSKTNNEIDKLTYQKVPTFGITDLVCIISFILILGLMIYSHYYKDQKVLTCTKNGDIKIDDNKLSYSATVKLTFKNDIYNKGTIKQTFDLTNYSDKDFDKVGELDICNNILIPSKSNNQYSYEDCNKVIDGKKIIISANYNIKSENEIKLTNEKNIFEKSGYKCE